MAMDDPGPSPGAQPAPDAEQPIGRAVAPMPEAPRPDTEAVEAVEVVEAVTAEAAATRVAETEVAATEVVATEANAATETNALTKPNAATDTEATETAQQPPYAHPSAAQPPAPQPPDGRVSAPQAPYAPPSSAQPPYTQSPVPEPPDGPVPALQAPYAPPSSAQPPYTQPPVPVPPDGAVPAPQSPYPPPTTAQSPTTQAPVPQPPAGPGPAPQAPYAPPSAAQPPYAQSTAPQAPYAQPYAAQAPYAQPPALQAPYVQQPSPSQSPYYGWGAPLPPPPPRPRIPRRAIAGALAIVLVTGGAIAGGFELAKSSSGPTAQPTTGDAAQDAAVRAIWRTTPISQLLPPTIAREGSESYIRLGINPDDSCAALPSAFTAALAPTKCAHLLSATYVDRTQTVTASVGIVVLSGSATDRLRLFQAWNADTNATNSSMMPHVYPVPGTVAAGFSDKQRVAWQSQFSVDGTYLAYAVAGFTDGRTGPGTAAIAAGSGSALSSSSPAVQVVGDLPAAIQNLLSVKLNAARTAQGGAS